ncbi:DUF309 domain-containing protein [Cohnella zeiphila]|uniref:DUF309 domain-containing protein n=1 Tax=Cohnella zeiphila TaxID=2761120 RepID=A0A7X0SI50_9BACL|nr:DUF309 domain-containing protein [Cohnella zeiphila]MBB6730382.1 DUF309 domain-containing protein [Cohnella zeiphila]
MTLSPYPESLIDYLAEYFGSRDFFECHEIMEEHWKRDGESPLARCWLALIRIAVMQYHARRGNQAGAYKLLVKTAEEFEPEWMGMMGLDGTRLADMLRERREKWTAPDRAVYEEFELPIADPELLRLARQACEERGWSWRTPLHAVPDEVVHRHHLRDRREVIASREKAAEAKSAQRQSKD